MLLLLPTDILKMNFFKNSFRNIIDQTVKRWFRSKSGPLFCKSRSGSKLFVKVISSVYQKIFSYFSTKTYVVGTQKNCLNETVLLSDQNIQMLKLMGKKIFTILRSKFTFYLSV